MGFAYTDSNNYLNWAWSWNVFLIFYSAHLEVTSVRAGIHIAIGLKQH